MEAREENGQVRSAREALDRWLSETPKVTRGLTLGLLVCFVLGSMAGSAVVATVPALVVAGLQVHRVVLSPLFEGNVLSLLIVVSWINGSVVQIERQVGSQSFGSLFARVAVASNVVFCFICYLLFFIAGNSSFLFMGTQGLFPTLVAFIVLFFRGPMRLMFIPQPIPAKYFPLALIAFLTILSGSIPFDVVSGYLVGLLFDRYGLAPLQQGQQEMLPQFANATRGRTLGSSESPAATSSSFQATAASLSNRVTNAWNSFTARASETQNPQPGSSVMRGGYASVATAPPPAAPVDRKVILEATQARLASGHGVKSDSKKSSSSASSPPPPPPPQD